MESSISDRHNSQTLNLTKLDDKIQLVFDYEMNYTKIKDILKESKLFYYDENNDLTQINYDLFFDKLKPLPKIIPNKDPNKAKYNSSIYDEDFEEIEDDKEDDYKKANIFKRLVSKQKRRFHDSDFDLDMSYITEKVIAMGFPSTGVQALYRNSLADIIKFFKTKHNDIVKVYNLCIEKDRIYNKDIFPNSKVGLFPATDHNPSPIKLILEFCIDICLYLIKNPKGVAAVHCKAGKGRTGVMICSYLVFSGLCKNCEQAFRYYGRMRTKNNTGVTIASQRRYIRYFETFLKANFYPPYYKLIPKIIKSQFSFLMDEKNNIKITNILQSFQTEESYFISANKFKLKGVKVGPLPHGKDLKIKVCNFVDSKFKLKNKKLTEVYQTDKNNAFYEQNFMPELLVHSDIKITIKNDFNFYVWVNFWHSTLEMIRIFNEEYGVRKKSEINSIHDLKFTDLVGKKVDKKKKVKITNIYSENNDSNETNPLYDKIQSLVHNSDLNELLELIESNSDFEFDKDNMSIKVNSTEFDKFQEKKEYTKSFEMIIFYSLSNK
jgi:protein-tyrosine phosphatase